MAIERTCDLCGAKIYRAYNNFEMLGPGFGGIFKAFDIELDFCEECKEKLLKWIIKNRKLNKENNR